MEKKSLLEVKITQNDCIEIQCGGNHFGGEVGVRCSLNKILCSSKSTW